MKKRLSYTIDVLLVAIIVLLGYTQVSMMLNKKYGVPSAFGVSFLYVVTDSMDDGDAPNSMPAGTGIIIQEVKDETSLRLSTPIYKIDEKTGLPVLDEEGNKIIKDYEKDGDAVTFYYPKIEYADTHRVVDTWEDENGVRWFKTMGDNPTIHQRQTVEIWEAKYLIGKVIYYSKALGTLLEISSPQIAASVTAITKEQHTAWLLPVAIAVPVLALILSYVIKNVYKAIKEDKIRQKKIDEALLTSGIDLNDEAAVELFRMKEELRLEYREELERQIEIAKENYREIYEKEKKKIAKELKNAAKTEQKEENRKNK